MAESTKITSEVAPEIAPYFGKTPLPYEEWISTVGIPVHRGYFIPDLRTVELGWWPERQCNAAFVQLAGQEGIGEARVTEIPPGETLPAGNFALDELVYVVSGRGLTTVSTDGSAGRSRTFEWQKHSLFMLPRGATRQFSNVQGDAVARLLHYNYLPLAMSLIQDPAFFFREDAGGIAAPDVAATSFYSEATVHHIAGEGGATRNLWFGNFFPDMRAWERLDPLRSRGAGGSSVLIRFPDSQTVSHMSVIPAYRYKKAHRHGPSVFIVIPAGEGYSIMWQEGHEKTIVPWQEGSGFVPPNRWFHQHFNLGAEPARYLALHPLQQVVGVAETIEDRARDQIEYPDEEPWIREKFESELAKRGLRSSMPDGAYKDRNFEWSYD